ncbi:MAG: 3-phosphoshikimate 1-carboxyvinyltransferase [Thermodesulfobacteria bacterium]|nr:3-phosphoshikimate 1-carboxyvinyltransferase [Thermodesulfobacteriota bacterium]
MQSDKAIEIALPGSKSITQRALITSALAQGTSRLVSPLDSEDTQLLRDGLRAFGVEIDDSSDNWLVTGKPGNLAAPSQEIFMGNNGTGIRFMMSFAALAKGTTVLTGKKRMEERPAGPLLDALEQLGVKAESIKGTGCPPVRIESQGLGGGNVRLSASISSQFLSSLLLVAPYANAPVTISLDGKLVSRPYVDITLRVMSDFGIDVTEQENTFFVPQGQYEAKEYVVEADASSASYFFAAAAITGASVLVTNMPPHPIQGDASFVDLLERMGCKVERSERGTMVQGPPPGSLKAIEIDMSKWPDVVPTLAVVAAFANGKTVITNVEHLRVKETDRITAVVNELKKLGCKAEELPDGLIINGNRDALKGALVNTYDDHRIAMCFAVASLLVPGIEFDDRAVVQKSFPRFWSYWERLKQELARQDKI